MSEGKYFALVILLAAFLPLLPSMASGQSGSHPGQTESTRQRRTSQQDQSGADQASPDPNAGVQTPPGKQETRPGQEDDVVRIETDLTNVLFTAVDKNKHFIVTLKLEDVRVLEDGVPQKVFTFERETDRPLSLAILIDTSASQEMTLGDEKTAARAFVDSVLRPVKDEACVVSFTGDATLEQGVTGNVDRVRRAIDRVQFVPPSGYIGRGRTAGGTPPISDQSLAGSTAIWDAIDATSREVLQDTSDTTRRAIILITDGEDTSSRLHQEDAVKSAIKADAVIYSVGIGDSYNFDGVNKGVLRKVSERTGGRAYFPKNDTDLRSAFREIQDELRSQYLVAYAPSNKKRDGSYRHVSLEIVNPELKKQNLRLTYRDGYFAKSSVAAETGAPREAPAGNQ